MAKGIRALFPQETLYDRYWFKNLHALVVLVGGGLEGKAYDYVTEQGRFGYHTRI